MEIYEEKKEAKPAKTVLVCFNGFQNSDTHDATSLMDYFDSNFRSSYEIDEIKPVHLFYPGDKKSHRKGRMEKLARAAIEEEIQKGNDIILLGYSFSATLAAKMAKVYRKSIGKVIYVAPIYDTIVNGMIPHYIQYAFKFLRLMKKYGKRAANTIGRKTTKGLPGLLISILFTVLADRKYYHKTRQEALIIRGEEDMLCTEHSLKKVSKKIKAPHQVLLYPEMTHGIMKSVKENGKVYDDLLHFAFDTPLLLQNNPLKPKKKAKVRYDIDGRPIPTFAEIFSELDPDAESEDRENSDAI